MSNFQEYLNINERKGFPRSYWFNRFIRWFTIIFSFLAIIYAVWLNFNKVHTDSSNFTKLVPFLIIFFALNSLLRNLFTLNRLIFRQGGVEFAYLLKRNVYIPWKDFVSIKLTKARQKILDVHYRGSDGELKLQGLTLAFPNMLEILNGIIEMVPQAVLDDFVGSIAVAKEENRKAENNEGQSTEDNA